MKKLAVFFFVLVITFGFLTFYVNKDFSFSGYLQNLTFEERPELPSLSDDDGNNVFESESSFWTKCAKFFSFIWDCIKYPFQILVWIFNCVGHLFGGLIA